MRQRTRKLVGTIVLAIGVPIYVLFVMTVASVRMAEASTLTQTLFFLVTGLIWVLPAGILIRWMQRSDPGPGKAG